RVPSRPSRVRYSCRLQHLRSGRAASLELRGLAVGRVKVDNEFELGRLQHRHVGRIFALQDAAGINAGLEVHVEHARSISHQPAGFGIFMISLLAWQAYARRALNSSPLSRPASFICDTRYRCPRGAAEFPCAIFDPSARFPEAVPIWSRFTSSLAPAADF